MTILRRKLVIRLWILVSILWLAASAWITVQGWSGERVSSQEYLLFNGGYRYSWRSEHPECRDRFAFWPDGKPINPTELSVFGDISGPRAPHRTDMPAEVVRDWINKVRGEISDCEEAQWIPIARAAAIREERISLVAITLLPPIILFLAGVSIMLAWTRFAKVQWLSLPMHQRRGLLRLYLIVVVPWVAWFGYKFYDGIQHHSRYIAHAFWSLLSVPIGGPILLLVIVWVISGFRKSAQ
jgi:hypothetical protein